MESKRMIKVFFGAALAALVLVGCGDETTNVTGLQTVANLQEAGKCAAGDMVLNLEDSQVYICGSDNKWSVLKGEKGDKGDDGEKGEQGDQGEAGEPGASCTATAVETGGYVLICGGEFVGVISSGSSGTPGAPGTSGASCNGRSIDSVGVEISCGGVVIDTLKNGQNGSQGLPGLKGDNGTSCTATPVANGVEIYCGDQLVTTIVNGNDGAAGASCTLNSINVNGLDGVEITCGAQKDTVMNGAQGVQGYAGQSCSGRKIEGVGVEITCGGSVIDTLRNGQGEQGNDSTGYEEVPVVVVNNMTITGVAQKGPFVSGSNVTVRELDGRTLAQTGKSFTGQTSNGSGAFSVTSVTLASQYAQLEVNGFYQNEVTGQNSNAAITLNALVDLSKSENVNINVLTHLESPRVRHLVATGMNVPAAKNQAEREILVAFGITGDFASFEELNILSASEGDAALLAVSVLMQSNLSEVNLFERLANFASDIEDDGKWDDEVTKAAMADWAIAADLAAIRSHIEGWSSGNQAPAFESAFRAFWWNIYGLGICDASNDGEIKQDTNSLSANHDVHYVCDTSIANWREATFWDFPKETRLNPNISYGMMTDNRDGQTYKTVVIGSQTWMAENLNYDYKINGASYGNGCHGDTARHCSVTGRLYTWAAAVDTVTTGCGYGKDCAADLIGRVQGVCPDGWHLPNRVEWDSLFAAAAVVGQSAVGTALKTTSGWIDNGNGADVVGFSALPSGYRNNGGGYNNAGDAFFWSSSPYNTYNAYRMSLSYASAEADLYGAFKNYGFAVRCVQDSWRNNYGLGACSAANPGEIKQDANSLSSYRDTFFICDASTANWRRATVWEYDTYQWAAGSDGAIRKGSVTDAKYKYDELQDQWKNANQLDTELGLNGCTQKRETEAGRGNDGTWYICRSEQWQTATVLEYDTYQKTCSNNAEIVSGAVVEANKYVCDAGSFRAATAIEKACGRGCTSYNLEEEKLVGGYMQCSSSGVWSVGRTVSATLTDTRDGKTYATIGIGTQVWMAENLNYDYKVNGASYGNGCYDNNADSCVEYSRLYTWAAAMDSATTGCGYGKQCDADTGRAQGVCPNGWHLPNSAEWQTLFSAVGGQSSAGAALKASTGWAGGNGRDEFGFSAFPTDGRYNDAFSGAGYDAYFWASSENGTNNAYRMALHSWTGGAGLGSDGKRSASAVRCLRD